ncbi:MAG: hypothetical protein SOX38_01070 [Candidatus Limiplasma sp.]|nr:hypothetical protein [Clostridiales bacterium]MDY3242508.1 hypothetical protein [Candidatus Limiplasma sp.]
MKHSGFLHLPASGKKSAEYVFAPDGKNEFGPFEMTGTSFFAGHTMFHVKHCACVGKTRPKRLVCILGAFLL